jgi:hypothetical protein
MLMPHVVKFCESPRFDIVVRRGKREHRIAKLIFRVEFPAFCGDLAVLPNRLGGDGACARLRIALG